MKSVENKKELSEETVIQLILNAGNARRFALQAIDCASDYKFGEATKFIGEANRSVVEAHNSQTDFIKEEVSQKEPQKVSLLMIHAQDHLMNALTVIELAEKMIVLYEKMKKGEST